MIVEQHADTTLTVWQSLKSFQANFECLIGDAEIDPFGAQRSRLVRDSYCAIGCARAMGVRELRLNPNDARSADFELRLRNGQVIPFQTTQADFKDRKLHQEHKQWRLAGYPLQHDPQEDWRKRRMEIGPALLRAVANKVSRQYPPETCLMIYLNLGTYDCWRDEIEPEIMACAAPAVLWFRSVWVLWGGRLYRCAPNPCLGSSSTFRPQSTVVLGKWKHRTSIETLFE